MAVVLASKAPGFEIRYKPLPNPYYDNHLNRVMTKQIPDEIFRREFD